MMRFVAISLTAALTLVPPLTALAQQAPPGPPRITPAPPAATPPAKAPAPAPAPAPAAAPTAAALPDWFKEIDTANSGVVTREQFVAYRMKLFDQLDANKDGTLSKEEFLKLAEPPFTPEGPNLPPLEQRREFYEKQFETIDTDVDGKVTRAEVSAYVALGFREFDIDMDGRATREEVLLVIRQAQRRQDEIERERNRTNPDRNNDGVIDAEEFAAFETGRMLELDTSKDGKVSLQEWLVLAGQPNQNPPGQPPYQQRRDALTKRFQELDTNKDGQLDQAEIRAMALALFKKIDADGNGKVTPQEWQVANTPQAQPQPPAQAQPKPATAPGPGPAAQPKPAPGPGPRPVPAPAPAPGPGGLQPGVPLGR